MNAQLDGEFREFMRARWPVMVRLAYGLTGDQGHAEDVGAGRVRAGLCVLAEGQPERQPRRVRAADRGQREPKPVPQAPGDRTADGLAAGVRLRRCGEGRYDWHYDDRSMLIAALQRLGPRQRAVIVLRYWMDLTEYETAAVLNCSVGTVKSQASRALATLRQDTELVDEGFQ
jgi:hypothetical protein